jgi:hypothetical protein
MPLLNLNVAIHKTLAIQDYPIRILCLDMTLILSASKTLPAFHPIGLAHGASS